jgi:hypothetical protein
VSGGKYKYTKYTNAAELYDPLSRSWKLIEGMIYPRKNGAAVKLLDVKVLVIGGFYDKSLDSAELFYP